MPVARPWSANANANASAYPTATASGSEGEGLGLGVGVPAVGASNNNASQHSPAAAHSHGTCGRCGGRIPPRRQLSSSAGGENSIGAANNSNDSPIGRSSNVAPQPQRMRRALSTGSNSSLVGCQAGVPCPHTHTQHPQHHPLSSGSSGSLLAGTQPYTKQQDVCAVIP